MMNKDFSINIKGNRYLTTKNKYNIEHMIYLFSEINNINVIIDILDDYEIIEYYIIVIYNLLLNNNKEHIKIIIDKLINSDLYFIVKYDNDDIIFKLDIDKKDNKLTLIKYLIILDNIIANGINKKTLNDIIQYLKLSNYHYAKLYKYYNLNETISKFITRLNIKPTVSFYIELLKDLNIDVSKIKL